MAKIISCDDKSGVIVYEITHAKGELQESMKVSDIIKAWIAHRNAAVQAEVAKASEADLAIPDDIKAMVED